MTVNESLIVGDITVKYQRGAQSVQAPSINILRSWEMHEVRTERPPSLKCGHEGKDSVMGKV